MPVEINITYVPPPNPGGEPKFVTTPALPIRYSVSMFVDREVAFINRSPDKTLQLRLPRGAQCAFEPPVPSRGRVTLYPAGTSSVRLKVRESLEIRPRRKGAFDALPEEAAVKELYQYGFGFEVWDLDAAPIKLAYAGNPPNDPDIMIEC